MDLISCIQCGVVLDKNNLSFPDIYDHDTQKLIEGTYEWNGKEHVPFIDCPICGSSISF